MSPRLAIRLHRGELQCKNQLAGRPVTPGTTRWTSAGRAYSVALAAPAMTNLHGAGSQLKRIPIRYGLSQRVRRRHTSTSRRRVLG